MSRAPRASGYFRTSYAQDLALVGTRLERTSLGVFMLALLAFPFAGLGIPARSRLPGFSRLRSARCR